jgi:hypothetical protein
MLPVALITRWPRLAMTAAASQGKPGNRDRATPTMTSVPPGAKSWLIRASAAAASMWCSAVTQVIKPNDTSGNRWVRKSPHTNSIWLPGPRRRASSMLWQSAEGGFGQQCLARAKS